MLQLAASGRHPSVCATVQGTQTPPENTHRLCFLGAHYNIIVALTHMGLLVRQWGLVARGLGAVEQLCYTSVQIYHPTRAHACTAHPALRTVFSVFTADAGGVAHMLPYSVQT